MDGDISLMAFIGKPPGVVLIDHKLPKQSAQERGAVHYLYFKNPHSKEIFGDIICKNL